MKKRTKLILSLAVACAGTFVLGACGGEYNDKIYKEGGEVKVTFNPNGGVIDGIDANLVYYFQYSDVETGIQLYAPDDGHFTSMQVKKVTRAEYFLAGWYSNREPRTDNGKPDGNPVDDDGNICNIPTQVPVLDSEGKQTTDENGKPVYETLMYSENGKPQAYVYSDRWNFEKKDKLTKDKLTKGEKFYELTLYAAWVPNYTYNIWIENEGEWEIATTTTFNPVDSGQMRTLKLPSFNEKTGGVDNNDFPIVQNRTFRAAYKNEGKTEKIEGTVEHPGAVDEKTGIGLNQVLDVYCEYDVGVWFIVHTAEQFASAMQLNGCFDIQEDLDFTDVEWPSQIISGSYAGTIKGNGHTIRNVTTACIGNDTTIGGGLFGSIQSGARFENITFENITFTVNNGSRYGSAAFGLFAADVNAGATFENVKVSGTLMIGTEGTLYSDTFTPNTGSSAYKIRALVGDAEKAIAGLEDAGIEVKHSSKVILTKLEDGSYRAEDATIK